MRTLIGMALAVALLLAAPAAANNAAPATGSFTVSALTVTSVRPASDATCLIDLTATFSFTGTLQGSFTAPFTIVHRGPCDQPAPERFVARGTFSGAIALDGRTRTGTFDFIFVGTIDAAGNARGTLHVQRGTEQLEGLGGAVELVGISGVGGTYTGTLRF